MTGCDGRDLRNKNQVLGETSVGPYHYVDAWSLIKLHPFNHTRTFSTAYLRFFSIAFG